MRDLHYAAQGYVFHEDKVLLVYHKKLNMWLPPGGHVEPNETPDECVKRELKEEVNLEVRLIDMSWGEVVEPVKEVCAVPFHTEVHSVGDHDHYGMYFACIALNPSELEINGELKESDWFTEKWARKDPRLMRSTKNQIESAFEVYKGYKIKQQIFKK